jgi:hypothetical protein
MSAFNTLTVAWQRPPKQRYTVSRYHAQQLHMAEPTWSMHTVLKQQRVAPAQHQAAAGATNAVAHVLR